MPKRSSPFVVLACLIAWAPVSNAQATTTSAFSFSPNFSGENCDALVAALKKEKVEKSEFETSADFSKRMQDILEVKSVAGRRLSEPMYFLNPKVLSAVFDADRQSMKVYGAIAQSTRVSPTNQYASTVTLSTRSSNTSQYAAQNRFGASTGVTRYRHEICGLAFLNVSPVTDHQWMGSIEFPLSPEAARRIKDKIAIVYLAQIAPPLLAQHRKRAAPTLSEPIEVVVTGDALTAVLENFFVINRITGEVLFERVYTPR
jgi:hypothetical protein